MMPRWLAISLAVVCWCCAPKQLRMSHIYRGKIYSPAIGPIEPNPTLTAIALRSAVTLAAYGLILLTIPWPRFLTYLSLVWVWRAAADIVFGRFGAGSAALLTAC